MKRNFLSIAFFMTLLCLSSCGGSSVESLAKQNAGIVCELKDLISDTEKNKSSIKSKIKSFMSNSMKKATLIVKDKDKAKAFGETYLKELKDGCGLTNEEALKITGKALSVK